MYQGQKVHPFCPRMSFLAEAQARLENRRGQKPNTLYMKKNLSLSFKIILFAWVNNFLFIFYLNFSCCFLM
jgi:hypothetical protein